MQLCRCDNVSFRYDSQPDSIFEHVSFTVYEHDRIGLIGKNGCGKSTLLDILQKNIQPIEGSVYQMPELSIGYLPQELDLPENTTGEYFLWNVNPRLGELKQKIDDLDTYSSKEVSRIFSEFETHRGYDFQVKLEKIITRFGFDNDMLSQQVKTLSGGEQTRLALCRILLTDPDMLLLDEPTNHLDIQALQWLERFLNEFEIPYILISHDRYILDACVITILELTNEGIMKYSGNYSFYKQEKELELQRKVHTYEEQNKKIKKLKEAANKRKKWAISHQPQTGSEGYAPVYEDLVNFAKNAMVQAKNLERRTQREIEKAESEKPFLEKERHFHFENSGIKSRFVLQCDKVTKTFSSKTVFRDLELCVHTGERLAIVGNNGSGKSTLLKILTNNMNGYDGSITWSPQAKIGYYSQDYENLDFENSVLDEVTQGDNNIQTFARTVLGCLNISEKLINQPIKTLSIGERSKVALAKLIVSKSNVLVLDEPTNHLEIAAREALEEALREYKGTLIFATHDRFLIDTIADRTLDLSHNMNF